MKDLYYKQCQCLCASWHRINGTKCVIYINNDRKDPGDYFPNIDAAANDFGITFNDNSIRVKVEYGSEIFIIHNEQGQIGYTYTIPNVGKYKSDVVSSAPMGTEVVADIHTHGESSVHNKIFYSDNEFSGASKSLSEKELMAEHSNMDIGMANKRKIISFLVTPNGSLQKYDPKTGIIIIINNKMPNDSKDPTRKNDVSTEETKNIKAKDFFVWQIKINQEATNERIRNIR